MRNTRRSWVRRGGLTALVIVLALGAVVAAQAEPFKVRGIKGLWWQGIEKYQLALPWLAEHDLNFLMLCYSSFPASGMKWREEYTAQEKAQIGELAERGRKLGVDVCLSFNPGIWSSPPLVYSGDQDCDLALNKVKAMHALGVRWFALCLDDINKGLQPADQQKFGTLQGAQTYFVNRLWRGMEKLSPRPKFIFCPSAYLTAEMQSHMDYIKAIGEGVDPGVMMFWTGPQCCSSSITAKDARLVAKWLRRKPFIWDNFPVNDMFAFRPLLSPLKNRSADLAGEVSGYISNPMRQWYISTIPLATTAEYLTNPGRYDAAASMERLIKSYPADQQRAVRMLVDLYGSSFWGEKDFPPQPRFGSREEAGRLLPRYRALRRELTANPGLKNIWVDMQPTLESEIGLLESASLDRRIESPLKAVGTDFAGGAASVFGSTKYDRRVNYIYSKASGTSEMHTELYLKQLPASGASLRITGRNDDLGVNGKIQIMLNDYIAYEGPANFSSSDFQTKEFAIPASALKTDANVLAIRSGEDQGVRGSPPWFMISEAELIPGNG